MNISKIVSILATFAIIFIGSMVFPNIIICESWKAALLAAIILAVAELLIALIVIGVLFGASFLFATKNSFAFLIIAFIMAFILGVGGVYIALLIAENVVNGFAIAGVLPRIIIALIIGACSAGQNKSSKNKD